MTTARERYEAKTRVVTFRVSQELYDDLEEIRKQAALSFADLIKLGAGIAREEIEAKITETSELQNKLEQLREAMQKEKQLAADVLARERQTQLKKLEREFQAFHLFDLGWNVDEVTYKLGMTRAETSQHLKVWCEMRGEKEKLQAELLTECVRKHIDWLQEQIYWRATKGALEEAKGQLERCRNFLIDPTIITEVEKRFLLAEYSYLV